MRNQALKTESNTYAFGSFPTPFGAIHRACARTEVIIRNILLLSSSSDDPRIFIPAI